MYATVFFVLALQLATDAKTTGQVVAGGSGNSLTPWVGLFTLVVLAGVICFLRYQHHQASHSTEA